jgi:hypothetical protein
MKWLICPLLLVLALHTATEAPGARRPPEAVDISGKELLPLTHWASANGLEIRWLKRDETLQLSSRSTKIVLTVDSREAQLNGTEVWLLFPVVQRNGTVYLSQLDLQTTLEPIIAPPKNRPGAAIKSVCLDPGHGGKEGRSRAEEKRCQNRQRESGNGDSQDRETAGERLSGDGGCVEEP